MRLIAAARTAATSHCDLRMTNGSLDHCLSLASRTPAHAFGRSASINDGLGLIGFGGGRCGLNHQARSSPHPSPGGGGACPAQLAMPGWAFEAHVEMVVVPEPGS